MQRTLSNEFFNRAPSLVVWIDLNQRLRPVTTSLVFSLDVILNIRGCNPREAPGEGTVLVNQVVAEAEDVLHGITSKRLDGQTSFDQSKERFALHFDLPRMSMPE